MSVFEVNKRICMCERSGGEHGFEHEDSWLCSYLI